MTIGYWDTVQAYLEQLTGCSWKLTKSTGKAAWIAGTTLLILAVPLVVEMDRDQSLAEFENQQLGALTGGPVTSK